MGEYHRRSRQELAGQALGQSVGSHLGIQTLGGRELFAARGVVTERAHQLGALGVKLCRVEPRTGRLDQLRRSLECALALGTSGGSFRSREQSGQLQGRAQLLWSMRPLTA